MTAFRFSRVEPGESLSFSCGKPDLDNFFATARPDLERGLYIVSYKLCLEAQSKPVSLVCIANDAIKNSQINPQPPQKWPFESHPSVRIAAFAVAEGYKDKGIGRAVITLLQSLFVLKNRTGCRYMTVDAYLDSSTPAIKGRTLNFYKKYGEFVNIPENPKANPGKIPKPKRNATTDTAPLYYDLNRMKIALEGAPDLLEEMRIAQKEMAEIGSTSLIVPDPTDLSPEEPVEQVA